jgi:amidophosphoribosyltransferase
MTVQRDLQRSGSIFSSTSDTETMLHLVAVSPEKGSARQVHRRGEEAGGRVLLRRAVVEEDDRLPRSARHSAAGARRPRRFVDPRVGNLRARHHGRALCARCQPGEVVVVTETGVESHFPFEQQKRRFCIFEYVYFARPDSHIEGRNVYEARKNIGMELAREKPVEADVVVPVPDSGVPSAIGYAQEAGLPFELGIIRNHYVGRTFIQPTDSIRHMGVKLKHNANRHSIEGKRVILVDDSIVRGTTSQKIVQMVREAGAKEVHMRIASPPTMSSCYYGVDTPETNKLLASRMSVEEMANFIRVDSLGFLTIDGLYRAVGEAARDNDQPQFCDACFTGQYPTSLVDRDGTDNVRHLSILAGGN